MSALGPFPGVISPGSTGRACRLRKPGREASAPDSRRCVRSWTILGIVLRSLDPKKLFLILRRRPSPLPRASAGGFLPVLLIVAVLLCDGILGFTHQVSCDACGPTEVLEAHHGSATGLGEAGSGHRGNDDASSGFENHSYAAVVLAAIWTALLVLLGARRWREASPSRSHFRRHYPPFITHRPRGPTLPSLQVLRL